MVVTWLAHSRRLRDHHLVVAGPRAIGVSDGRRALPISQIRSWHVAVRPACACELEGVPVARNRRSRSRKTATSGASSAGQEGTLPGPGVPGERLTRPPGPPTSDPAVRSAEVEPSGETRGRPVLTWVAGIVSAVIITVVGAVFTAWFSSLGPATFDAVSDGLPVKIASVAVEGDPLDLALREPVTTQKDRAILLGQPDDAQREAFLERYRAAPVERMEVVVVLEGNRAGLRITDIRPDILHRGPVSDGALLSQATAGEVPAIEVVADLDKRDPRVTTAKNPRTAYFSAKQIDLVRGERTTIHFTVIAHKAYYEFRLVATVVSDGRAERVTITLPGGRPFRVSGKAKEYHTVYDESPMGGWKLPEFCGEQGAAC